MHPPGSAAGVVVVVVPVVAGLILLAIVALLVVLIVFVIWRRGSMDTEMKPNSLYDLTNDSESIVTKPNEVYGVSVGAELSDPASYDYVKS